MKTLRGADSSNRAAVRAPHLRWQDAADRYHACMFPSSPPPPLPDAAPPGTWPLFRFRGIRVFLHWSWILVAIYQINRGRGGYPHIGWDIAQYLTLFVFVTLHEFGHAFAARQVGGRAERILLWPFGGIAFVDLPPRPGAYLWGIAAGPLVNVALFPVLYLMAGSYCDPLTMESLYIFLYGAEVEPLGQFLYSIFFLNTLMLVFNLLPVFPMDGGQMLRGVLWYMIGPVKSLLVAAWTGLILGGAMVLYSAFVLENIFMAVMIGLMVYQSWSVIQNVRGRQMQRAGQ